MKNPTDEWEIVEDDLLLSNSIETNGDKDSVSHQKESSQLTTPKPSVAPATNSTHTKDIFDHDSKDSNPEVLEGKKNSPGTKVDTSIDNATRINIDREVEKMTNASETQNSSFNDTVHKNETFPLLDTTQESGEIMIDGTSNLIPSMQMPLELEANSSNCISNDEARVPFPGNNREDRSESRRAFKFQNSFKNFSVLVKNTVHKIDDKIKISDKAKLVGKTIGEEASKIGTNAQKMGKDIGIETGRIGKTIGKEVTKLSDNVAVMGQNVGRDIKDSYVEHDIGGKSKDVATKARVAARTTGLKVKDFNERYQVLDTLVKAGVIVGAVAIAGGNARAGATAMAVAGTAFVASEGMRPQNEVYNQRVHLD